MGMGLSFIPGEFFNQHYHLFTGSLKFILPLSHVALISNDNLLGRT